MFAKEEIVEYALMLLYKATNSKLIAKAGNFHICNCNSRILHDLHLKFKDYSFKIVVSGGMYLYVQIKSNYNVVNHVIKMKDVLREDRFIAFSLWFSSYTLIKQENCLGVRRNYDA